MLDIAIANITRFDGEGKLKAFCDIIVSDTILVRGVRIVEGKNGLFVGMPDKQGKNGKWYQTVRPMSDEIKDAISETVLRAFNE